MLADAGVHRTNGVGAGSHGCRCLDAGCVFVPLEPRQPRFRLRALLDAVPLAAVLAAPQHEAAVVANGGLAVDCAVDVPGGLRYLRLVAAAEAPLPVRNQDLPEPFAYVVFTSGSTGTPKPVFAPLASIASNVRSLVYGFPWLRLEYSSASSNASTTDWDPSSVAQESLPAGPGGRGRVRHQHRL